MTKTVFVTGATGGTGYAIACRFAKEGYAVLIGSRSGDGASAAAQSISETYGVFTRGYETRIGDEENVRMIYRDAEEAGHPVTALVLNAANLGIGQSSLDVPIDEFMSVFHTNVGWNFMMAREAIRQMIRHGGGSIVFITSNSAVRVTENRCAYCASKSAILAMSKSLALDFGRYGIRSNCVLPGMIKTERWQKNENGIQRCLPNYTPLRDIAEFEDVANAAWYFGSEESRNTTGAELVVDGGMLSQLTPNLNNTPVFLAPEG